MLRRSAAAACLTWLIASPSVVSAQDNDTRAAVLEQQRAAKAAQLEPYKPGRLERALLFVERQDPVGKFAPYNGFFIQYGYTDRPTGAGIAFSGGYRHDLFNRRARVQLEAGMSLRKYQLLRADFSAPYLAGDRAEIGIEATYRNHPQEDFYGLGPASVDDDRTNFLYKGHDLQARAVAKPVRWLRAGTRAGLLSPSVGSGTDSRFPTLETRFSDAQAPGLLEQPEYLYVDGFAAADTRDHSGNARSGGFYEVSWRRYGDRDLDQFSFNRLEADLQQFFPIFDKKRVIAVRGRVVSTTARDGNVVPFYFKPTLGGGDSLRSYADYRFRDDHMMVVNLEYRWEAFSSLDMALFSDWGKVTARRGDLDFGSLKHAYGLGFRFNTYKSVFLRLDIAAGGDAGLRYALKFSNAF